jgi:phospholipase C
VSPSPSFDFTRLGPRVPALFISPWIERNTVVHGPSGPRPNSQFDHASLHATLKLMFNLTSFLTARDAWAGTFDGVFSSRSSPRTDCPVTLPAPRPLAHRKRATGHEPLSDLQRQMVGIAAALNDAKVPADMTAAQGALFVRRMVNRFFNKNMYPQEEWSSAWDWNADA